MPKMKSIFFKILIVVSTYNIFLAEAADESNWLLKWVNAVGGKSGRDRIRTGDLHLDDIPNILKSLIDVFIWLAGTVSVLFIIIGWYKILYGSFQQDHSKWRSTIVMALTWFVISVLAWVIVQFIFDNVK